MKRLLIVISFAGALPLLAACSTDETLRMDGVSLVAGEAIAANTVMQMIDPWPRGVENTDLVLPADRTTAAEEGEKTPNGPSIGDLVAPPTTKDK